MTLMIHHIQERVIDVLAHQEAARYGDLKPSDMDGNQFTYHLKQLLTNKLVYKDDNGDYSLTQKGRSYLVTRFEDPDEMAHTIFLVIVRHEDRLLMRERKVQPLIGYTGFIHGEPVAGKALRESVRERVTNKTGLIIKDIIVCGSGLIRINKNGQPQSFSHAIIVQTKTEKNELPIQEDETGKNFWVSENELSGIKKPLPNCLDILQFAADPSVGWFEHTYDISNEA